MSPLELSGERFIVSYELRGSERRATEIAHRICIEQTIEFPEELVADPAIRRRIVGRLLDITPLQGERHLARITFAVEIAGGDLTQLLNVIFGNVSLMPGIRVTDIELPDSQRCLFSGPRFGRDGLREVLRVRDRPLLCTALKPLGTAAEELAELAYRFACGGIDIIKDDHGLADQSFCRFADRVEQCAAAIREAATMTGHTCLYAPNITAPPEDVVARARLAKKLGAGALLVAPGLVGLDTVRLLAKDDEIALPILSHPAFLGSHMVGRDGGLDHGLLLGTLTRLAGADAAIFPHAGGRFSFSTARCRQIAEATKRAMPPIRPIFPAPAGGMTLGRTDELIAFYGHDVILLIGGALHRDGDIIETCKRLHQQID